MEHQEKVSKTEKMSFAQKWAHWVIRYRWLVLLASLPLAFGLGYGGQFIQFDSDYHVFFSECHFVDRFTY